MTKEDSDKVIDIALPRSWQDLTSNKLCCLLRLIASERTTYDIKILCLLRWNGIRVVGRIGEDSWMLSGHRELFVVSDLQMAELITAMDWVDHIPVMPVRPERLRGRLALPSDLQGVPFSTFVMADNLYQGYIATHDDSLLRLMFDLLYTSRFLLPSLGRFKHWHGVAVFYWWASLKEFFARKWPDFFQPAVAGENGNLLAAPPSPEKNMNAMIRALTKGDVTKEAEILEMDTWRALEELNAQAAETAEFERKYGK